MKNIAALLLLVFLCSYDNAEQAYVAYRQRVYNIDTAFVALKGYDPVSYFKTKPTKGNPKIQYNYRGINYYFSSTLNRDFFRLNPAMYEPQYGGWCAFGISNGDVIDPNPEVYHITNGKLYLFCDFFADSRFNGWIGSYEVLRHYADNRWAKFK